MDRATADRASTVQAPKRPSDGTGELGDGVVDQQESLFMSILFAALSAAVGAAVSQLSDRGSKALVARRHRRQSD